MMINKTCLHCQKEFPAKTSKAKFCSDQHRNAHFQKNRIRKPGLSGATQQQAPTQEPRSTHIPVHSLQKITNQLDPASQMIFEIYKTQNSELRAELKEKNDEVKSLTKEKSDSVTKLQSEKSELQKQVDELTRNIDAKPTGLNGLLSNVDTQNKLIDGGLAMLASFLEQKQQATQQQLGAPAENAMMQWISALDKESQSKFMRIASILAGNAEALSTRLAFIHGYLEPVMGVNKDQQQVQQLPGKKVGYNR